MGLNRLTDTSRRLSCTLAVPSETTQICIYIHLHSSVHSFVVVHIFASVWSISNLNVTLKRLGHRVFHGLIELISKVHKWLVMQVRRCFDQG